MLWSTYRPVQICIRAQRVSYVISKGTESGIAGAGTAVENPDTRVPHEMRRGSYGLALLLCIDLLVSTLLVMTSRLPGVLDLRSPTQYGTPRNQSQTVLMFSRSRNELSFLNIPSVDLLSDDENLLPKLDAH